MLTKETLSKLQKYETPFYFYDVELLNKTLKRVCDEASKYGFRVHYAIKANHDAEILTRIKNFGLGADCVSGGEVKAAIEAGFNPETIVFAGVGKSDKEIVYALEKGIYCFNCESLQELEVISELAASQGVTARVALRINPDVEPETHKYISTGQSDSKFGISYDEVDIALERLAELKNIEIKGLHFHIGSQIRRLEVFKYLALRVNTLVEWFEKHGVLIDHINVGGGLGVNYDSPRSEPIPDFETYFKIFADNLALRQDQTLHFELGRSIVGQCGSLVSRVLYNKRNGAGKNYLIVDASMTELIRPALYQAKHNIVSSSEASESQIYSVAGGVCESSDVFARDITLPQSSRGDMIIFESAGAYGSAMASNYNLRPIPCSIFSDEI